jgi:hypothetical protein
MLPPVFAGSQARINASKAVKNVVNNKLRIISVSEF